jgi:hypothetical protein
MRLFTRRPSAEALARQETDRLHREHLIQHLSYDPHRLSKGTPMDPNAALTNLRAAQVAFQQLADGGDYSEGELLDAGIELADAVEVLDGWLSRGGFLPDAWKR